MILKVLGKNPAGERLEKIKKSKGYERGVFKNLVETEVILKNSSLRILVNFLSKPANISPPGKLPSVKSDLKNTHSGPPTIIWFGHSSYFIKSEEINILVDPVFSGYASPVPVFGKSFPGSDAYTVDDLPPIDVVIITHDHYDHLDYKTIKQLIIKTKIFCVPLGVGSHLEYWGIRKESILELDWWEQSDLMGKAEVIAAPSRHFSGRGLLRGKTLWASYILTIHDKLIFVGGDSGYDETFKVVGEKFGPFDLAILEAGQYGKDWPYIHMMPDETVQAALDLKAKVLLPVHWAKFALALHGWNESIKRLMEAARGTDLKVTTPRIGQPVILNQEYPDESWWECQEK